MNFNCPIGGSTVLVSNGTICACGSINSTDAVMVQVLSGWVACPSTPGGTSASVSANFWSASGVAVPTLGSDNKMTVCAWQIAPGASGSGGTTVVSAAVSQCFAGSGSGAVDCCAQCGSGAAQEQFLVAEVLIEETELVVDIPTGANAGTHRAVAEAPQTWRLTVAGVTHTVAVAGEGLVIRGPSGSVAAEVEFKPFSASFAGDLFGSDDDVVLTIP